MADRPKLSVVGGKATEPDAETGAIIARTSARMTEAVKTGGLFWVVTVVEGETTFGYYGGKLETSAFAEKVAGDALREALGLAGEE